MKNLLIILSLLVVSTTGAFAQDKIIYDIKVQGNDKTKSDYIISRLKTKKGEVLDSIRLDEEMNHLKRLPIVSHAYYQVFHSKENLYDVIINIEENFTLIPSANLYTTNNEEFAFRLGLTEYNLLGNGIELGGFFQYDNFASYAVNTNVRNILGSNVGLAVNRKLLSTLEPVFFEGGTTDYKYTNDSWELLGLFDINKNNHLDIGINIFKESYEFISGFETTTVPQYFGVDKFLIKTVFEHNDVVYEYERQEGIKSIAYAQFITSNDQTIPDFTIFWNDFHYYDFIGENGNWASRLRLGLSTNNDSPFAPFAIDNNLNIRGVGNTIDRGTGVVVFNTEYRHNVVKKENITLQSNVFLDAGTWRNPGGDLSDLTNGDNIRVYPGLGARIIHNKIYGATLRVDYGVGVSESDVIGFNASNGFVIGLGQYF